MGALARLGYRGLSMSGLEPYLRGEKRGKVFGITFDDGYENNLIHALPVLTHFGFSSTCYVVAGMVGQTNRWDAEKGIAQIPLMDAEQLQSWVNAGQEVGSHTVSHAMLATLNAEQQAAEIQQSKVMLESMVQQPGGVRHFCYPYGSLNEASVTAVRTAGYATATTTERGRVVLNGALDVLRLPRVLVSRTTAWPQLVWKCMTAYEDERSSRYAK